MYTHIHVHIHTHTNTCTHIYMYTHRLYSIIAGHAHHIPNRWVSCPNPLSHCTIRGIILTVNTSNGFDDIV